VGLTELPIAFLVFKMLTTAAIVVSASLIAERTGPLIAAMVATLPVSAGPVYVFLSLDHADFFISTAALGSMGSNTATAIFSLVYVLSAQRWTMLPALVAAFCGWALTLMAFKWLALPFPLLMAIVLIAFPMMHLLLRPFLAARPASALKLAWYAIPLRALFVAILVAIVTTLSLTIGAQWSGFLATFPVVLSTLVIFIQPRIGGPATAAIIASGLLGLMGFGVALGVVHLAAVPLGRWAALAIGLMVCLLWNLALVGWSRRA
jgi:hypothetical protein